MKRGQVWNLSGGLRERERRGYSCTPGIGSLEVEPMHLRVAITKLPQVLHEHADSAYDCWDKEELDACNDGKSNGIAAGKAAIAELISLTKSALQQLKSCIAKARKDAAEKKQKEVSMKKKAGKQVGALAKAGVPLHDHGANVAVSLEVQPQATWDPKKMSLGVPMLFTLPNDSPIMAKGTNSRRAVDSFIAKFETAKRDMLAKSAGKATGDFRAQRPLATSVVQTASDILDALVPAALVVPEELARELLQPEAFETCVYGIEKDYSQASTEKEHLATLRMCVSGTRTVMLSRTASWSAHFRGTWGTDAAAQGKPIKKLQVGFHNMANDAISLYGKQNVLYFATVAPGDCLFVPAGYILSEVVGRNADHYGIRKSYLFTSDCKRIKEVGDEFTLLTGKAPTLCDSLPQLMEVLAEMESNAKGDQGDATAGLEAAEANATEHKSEDEMDKKAAESGAADGAAQLEDKQSPEVADDTENAEKPIS